MSALETLVLRELQRAGAGRRAEDLAGDLRIEVRGVDAALRLLELCGRVDRHEGGTWSPSGTGGGASCSR